MLPLEPTSRTVRAGLTEQAAAELIQRHGRGALTILADRTETAEELGHRTAAKTWREMTAAAVRLLQVRGSDVDKPSSPMPFFVRHGSSHTAICIVQDAQRFVLPKAPKGTIL